jgi:hypothetical protein
LFASPDEGQLRKAGVSSPQFTEISLPRRAKKINAPTSAQMPKTRQFNFSPCEGHKGEIKRGWPPIKNPLWLPLMRFARGRG